jgi:hypothetical protein
MPAKSEVESVVDVAIGEDSPVDSEETVGDIGGSPSITGSGTVCDEGEGDEEWDEGGVRPAPPCLKACKSPVDRFIVNGL